MNLQEARVQIDAIDQQMKKLFIERMSIVKEIAAYKRENNLPIFDEKREKELKEHLLKGMEKDISEEYLLFIENLLILSKKVQGK